MKIGLSQRRRNLISITLTIHLEKSGIAINLEKKSTMCKIVLNLNQEGINKKMLGAIMLASSIQAQILRENAELLQGSRSSVVRALTAKV